MTGFLEVVPGIKDQECAQSVQKYMRSPNRSNVSMVATARHAGQGGVGSRLLVRSPVITN